MDLILIRLAATPAARQPDLSPEIVVDVLWANALPGDRLEHVRARQGSAAGSIDLVLFHRTAEQTGRDADEPALHLCLRAIGTAPALSGWTAAVDPEFSGILPRLGRALEPWWIHEQRHMPPRPGPEDITKWWRR
jgi:hypothetical protein